MKPVPIMALAATLSVSIATSAVMAGDEVDWLPFGATDGPPKQIMFYDTISMARAKEGRVKVWTVGLDAEKISAMLNDQVLPDSLAKQAAEKILKHREVAALASNLDTSPEFVGAMGAIADHASLHVYSRVFVEIDCAGKQARHLDIFFENEKGKSGARHTPGEWEAIAPATNFSRLMKYACAE